MPRRGRSVQPNRREDLLISHLVFDTARLGGFNDAAFEEVSDATEHFYQRVFTEIEKICA